MASIIVEAIREKGGRFLRRADTTPQGQVLWVDIGDDRAREKTCQALREGAPEIRKKRKTESMDDEDDAPKADHSVYKDGGVALSSSSSVERSASNEQEMNITRTWGQRRVLFVTETRNLESRFKELSGRLPVEDGPIMIRPSARLIRSSKPVEISVDQLEPHEREMYLRDFLPPNPSIRRKTFKQRVIEPSSQALASSSSDENISPWSVVKV